MGSTPLPQFLKNCNHAKQLINFDLSGEAPGLCAKVMDIDQKGGENRQ
jgi:hypothetical protein